MKVKPHFIHLCTSALPPKQCEKSKNRFIFHYIFINIILLLNSMYSKWYWQGLVQKKISPYFLNLCTFALPPKQCKTSKNNRFLLIYISKKDYFLPNSMYSKWYRKGLVQKKFNSHFLHLCTSALSPKQCKTSKKIDFI